MDIALFGQPKSGKTSIVKVIFNKMSPQQTLLLDATQKVETTQIKINSFNHAFNVYDTPGKFSPGQLNYKSIGVAIFVLDVQNEQHDAAIEDFTAVMTEIAKANSQVRYLVLFHKIDMDAEERKDDNFKSVKERLKEELDAANLKLVNIEYQQTSIYDHSIFEVFSRVIQRVVPNIQYVDSLLDSLNSKCRFEKIFLFDIYYKLFVGTDTSPVDSQNYAICSDMIDVYLDVSSIYGDQGGEQAGDNMAESLIKLSDAILYLKQVERHLVLVAKIKENNYDRPFLIDYNICLLYTSPSPRDS
eukprot:TRINITY_DN1064_c0_g1_i7.p1 TRINITY_DN1064_c0_g1~~TRINITY_DN1064_c0_g1_i7.p1  ORF type:complete len:301 (+),score=95.51 TRINITY_DN1064_c0_g1_i7:34-936(+)